MELTELSLAPTTTTATTTTTTQFIDEKLSSLSSESEYNHSSRKKRKFLSDHHHHLLKTTGPPIQTSVDLHVKDPLPLDWEQCLDLESGRMYYLNRKTLRKSWNWPKDQKLDLELNISPLTTDCNPDHNSVLFEDSKNNVSSPRSNMVALACLNCHLLVILSRSSPSCPNCKYVHSIPITHQALLPKFSPSKSLNTLSLLN